MHFVFVLLNRVVKIPYPLEHTEVSRCNIRLSNFHEFVSF